MSQAIYNIWKSIFPNDLRHLRPHRWRQLKSLITSRGFHKVLEFGSGVSTLLFESLGLQVTSYETDNVYMEKVKSLSNGNTTFHLWNNFIPTPPITDIYGLSLVDGANPRDIQLTYAITHSVFVAIDDYRYDDKLRFEPLMSSYKRLDDRSTPLAIFKVKYV